MGFDAIVLAGGAASRLGGMDKPALTVGGASLLARVLDAVHDAARRVVVGPRRRGYEDVVWCREEPPGGGPLAAIAAGLPHTTAPTVLVLAADLPSISPAVDALRTALAGTHADAAALLDPANRPNPLAAAWRRAALVRALAALAPPGGRPARALFTTVRVATVGDPQGWGADCDTWDDVLALRRRLTGRS